MLKELGFTYKAVPGIGSIFVDVSNVGTAVLEIDHAAPEVSSDADAVHELVDRMLERLPKTGVAVSVVVPIYNEEAIVRDLVTMLLKFFGAFPFRTELLLCENGSMDGTRDIALDLAAQYDNVTLRSLEEPSYGSALKVGIRHAAADLVVIFNADLWCKRFFVDAVLLLQGGYDMVIGSKQLVPSKDLRPPVRRAITRTFNAFLRTFFGFAGTDTHGMKALRRSRILGALDDCVTEREVFDTELVLRFQKRGGRICEVPTEARDGRPPRFSLLRRVPGTIADLYRIRRTL
jgi:glycosyltransferase AglD